MRVKERRSSNWQRQLTPTPKPEARPRVPIHRYCPARPSQTRTIVLVMTRFRLGLGKKNGPQRPAAAQNYPNNLYPYPLILLKSRVVPCVE